MLQAKSYMARAELSVTFAAYKKTAKNFIP
jgi:hypothetical protein